MHTQFNGLKERENHGDQWWLAVIATTCQLIVVVDVEKTKITPLSYLVIKSSRYFKIVITNIRTICFTFIHDLG